MKAFVKGVTAAAVGAIAGAVVILGRRALVDWLTVLIACTVLLASLKLKKIPEPFLILGAALVGLIRGA
jgi:chromate transporter